MKLTVLNSGSSGNGYLLQNGTEALYLECGVPRAKFLGALAWELDSVKGCLLTHEHGDHAKYIEDYLRFMPVYCSKGTAEVIDYKKKRRPIVLEALKTVHLGGFAVRPIPAEHDAAQPFAYIIDHADFGRLLFATDTYYLRYRIPKMNNIMIECNYSLPILNANIEAGIIPAALKNRTLASHMSLENLKKMLAANDLSQVSRIVLIHLSGNNANKEAFVRDIIAQTGRCTIAATKGLEIELNKTPF